MSTELVTTIFNMQESEQKRRTIVLGTGLSGVSVARFLNTRGEDFVVADTRENPPNEDKISQEFPDIEKFFGGLNAINPQDYSELVVSPGLPLDEPLVKLAGAAGLSVIGDIELFYRYAKAPLIAVTGSNGKSSVVTLVTDILKEAGLTAYCGGNIGMPALDLLALPTPDYYVLELSSFQLETTALFAPEIAALLNVSPDHMDRYASFQEYRAAKLNIFKLAKHCVVNSTERFGITKTEGNVLTFSADTATSANYRLAEVSGGYALQKNDGEKIATTNLTLAGEHHFENALCALAITDTAGVPVDAQASALANFRGLEHRTEVVGEWDSVRWINDSKGTNVGATVAALKACLQHNNGILIAGGVGKGADFTLLGETIAICTKAVVLFGEDAKVIAASIPQHVPVSFANNLKDAVCLAKQQAIPGDTVLFSPACASFDMFENYEARGRAFKQLVRVEVAE
ncbi:MAG: UDP-N-acetylmuramoyl-L-alanine--D-glutamate ligase [Pseudomonadota bacterium]